MDDTDLKFKGIVLSKKNLEEKYDFVLSDEEWKFFKSYAKNSWNEGIEEFRLLVSKHIRKGLSEIDYKPILKDNQLSYTKK